MLMDKAGCHDERGAGNPYLLVRVLFVQREGETLCPHKGTYNLV